MLESSAYRSVTHGKTREVDKEKKKKKKMK